MTRSSTYYLFLAFHGFLLGLFPFYLPVYLYKIGIPLSGIAFFIALSGLGFVITLWCWDRLRQQQFRWVIIASFLLGGSVVATVFFKLDLTLIALLNGAYNCLYWMIQRILFLASVSPTNSGRKFGNFQIFVMVVLKVGIFTGSILLESYGFVAICLISLSVASAACIVFMRKDEDSLAIPQELQSQKALGLNEVILFKDGYNSRMIFVLDGIFLYLESYFWLISLFFLVGQSFSKLGLVVIGLALFLALLFFLIKNSIDRLDAQKVYLVAVFLYASSWLMRGTISPEMSYPVQLCLILSIAFCSAFFRLSFNKRFFDLAGVSSGYRYIFVKSYFSQFFLMSTFLLTGFMLKYFKGGMELLPLFYWLAFCVTFLYLNYRPIKICKNDKLG